MANLEYLVTKDDVAEWSTTLPKKNINDIEFTFNDYYLSKIESKYDIANSYKLTDVADNNKGVIMISTFGGVIKITNQEVENEEYIEINKDISWSSIAYGNGIWVLCGGRYIAYSSDEGETWEVIKSTNSKYNYKSVTFGNGFFIIVGDIEMMFSLKSADGKSWKLISSNSTTDIFKKVFFYNNKFVAVGENNIIAYSNASGDEWYSVPVSNEIEIYDIICTNKECIMYGKNDIYDYISTSTDLVTWVAHSFLDEKSDIGISYISYDEYLNQLNIYMNNGTVYKIDYNFLDWSGHFKQHMETLINCENINLIYLQDGFCLLNDFSDYYISNRIIKNTVDTIDLMQKYLNQHIGDLYFYKRLNSDIYSVNYLSNKICTIDFSSYEHAKLLTLNDILVEFTQFQKYTTSANRTLTYTYDSETHILTITANGNLFATDSEIFANIYVKHKIRDFVNSNI